MLPEREREGCHTRTHAEVTPQQGRRSPGTHHPSLSAALTFTPNCTRNLTISVWPAHTALCRAVMPSSLGRLGSSTCDIETRGVNTQTSCHLALQDQGDRNRLLWVVSWGFFLVIMKASRSQDDYTNLGSRGKTARRGTLSRRSL